MKPIHETEDGRIGATQTDKDIYKGAVQTDKEIGEGATHTNKDIDEGAAMFSENCGEATAYTDEEFKKDVDKNPNEGTTLHLEMLDEAGHSSKDLLTGVLLTNEQFDEGAEGFDEGAVKIKADFVEGASQDNQEIDVTSDKGAENVHDEIYEEATQIENVRVDTIAQSNTRPIDFKLTHSGNQPHPTSGKVLVGKLLSIGVTQPQKKRDVTDVPHDDREKKQHCSGHKRLRLNSDESVGEVSEASSSTSAHKDYNIRGEGYGILPFATRPIPTLLAMQFRDREDPGDREPEEHNLNDSRAKSGTDDQTGSEDEARTRVVNDVRLSEGLVPLLNLESLKGMDSGPGSARSGASALSGASARDGSSARSNEIEWRRQMAMFPFYSLPMYGFPPAPFPPVGHSVSRYFLQ